MKKYLIHFIVLSLQCAMAYGQQGQDIVLVVDVSGSVNNITPARVQAQNILKDLVVRGQFDRRTYADWEFSTAVGNLASIRQGTGQPILGLNHKIFLRNAGEKTTSNRHVSNVDVCDDLDQFETFMDQHFPRRFGDQYTYLKLAKARAAQFAIQQNTCSYLLIELTDNREDQVPSSPYSSVEQDLVDTYGVRSNIETAIVGIIRYRPVSNYQIIISEVEIIGNNCQTNPPCGQVQAPEPPKKPRIVLNGLSKTRKSPRELNTKDGRLNLTWQCIDCPDKVKYRVILKRAGSGQSGITLSKSNLTDARITVNDLSSGEYEFTVSAAGTLVNIKSQKGYFKIKGGSGFWLFLLFAALAAGAFLAYKKIFSNKGSSQYSGIGRKNRKRGQEEDDFGEAPNDQSSDSFEF